MGTIFKGEESFKNELYNRILFFWQKMQIVNLFTEITLVNEWIAGKLAANSFSASVIYLKLEATDVMANLKVC